MTADHRSEKYVRLVRLIRRIAKEEAWQALDEHLDDYVHSAKPTEEVEME